MNDGMPAPLRLLFASNGTFVDMLEACLGEPVVVRKLDESTRALTEGLTALNLVAGTTVIDRHVLLCGGSSQRVLVDARALIVPGRLPAGVIEDLMTTDMPLGRSLVQRQVFNLRRDVAAWREEPGLHREANGFDEGETLACRRYVIEVPDGPAVLLTERLPLAGPWQ